MMKEKLFYLLPLLALASFEKNQEILTKSVSCAKLIKVRGY